MKKLIAFLLMLALTSCMAASVAGTTVQLYFLNRTSQAGHVFLADAGGASSQGGPTLSPGSEGTWNPTVSEQVTLGFVVDETAHFCFGATIDPRKYHGDTTYVILLNIDAQGMLHCGCVGSACVSDQQTPRTPR